MNSFLTNDFLRCFRSLPKRIQEKARKTYKIWKNDPNHPGIDFKRVGKNQPIYSVRIGIGWRALGIKEKDSMIWFWIGSHADYDKLL